MQLNTAEQCDLFQIQNGVLKLQFLSASSKCSLNVGCSRDETLSPPAVQ